MQVSVHLQPDEWQRVCRLVQGTWWYMIIKVISLLLCSIRNPEHHGYLIVLTCNSCHKVPNLFIPAAQAWHHNQSSIGWFHLQLIAVDMEELFPSGSPPASFSPSPSYPCLFQLFSQLPPASCSSSPDPKPCSFPTPECYPSLQMLSYITYPDAQNAQPLGVLSTSGVVHPVPRKWQLGAHPAS